ncbi:MAG TPA: amino acid-binding protein [Verrucomicrobiota bacterium]|nr:amino acid-binding protein [Verrucomicrobiota bacterium]
MNLMAESEVVWAASMQDTPGTLANKLAALAEAGADLGFIIARRSPEKPGTGVVFVTPLRGDREIEAATEEGFSATSHLHSVRVEGQNVPGIAALITGKIAKAGLNLRGFSGAVIGTQYVVHLAFDTAETAQQAIATLSEARPRQDPASAS